MHTSGVWFRSVSALFRTGAGGIGRKAGTCRAPVPALCVMADKSLGASELGLLTGKWEGMTPPYQPPGFVFLFAGRRRSRLCFWFHVQRLSVISKVRGNDYTTHSGKLAE